MMRLSSPSSSYGFILVVVLLLVTATGMGTATAVVSQFCDECTPEIFDITQPVPRKGIPTWTSRENVTKFVINETDQPTPDRKLLYGTIFAGTHWGTHVDAKAHLGKYKNKYNLMADCLNLNTLMGPVLVVETPRDSNLTAELLKSLNLPIGLQRVIFKTANTDRKLAEDTAKFYHDYTGFTADGAQWLVDNTYITFVGVDYMSVAIFANDQIQAVHTSFLENNVIPVEFLKLDGIEPGYYTVYCLHLKLNADGAPVRCILVR